MSKSVYKRLIILSVFAFALSLPNTVNADEGMLAYGGKIYDKWFKVVGEPKPADTHMSWPASNTKKKGNATHRCKSCHGWDYMGKDGAYASGSYMTGITGVRAHDGGDPSKVVAILKDKTHGYAGMMDDTAMMAVATFVTNGQVDMDKYIDRASKKAIGNAAKGKNYYGTLCVNCHGQDGRLPKEMAALGGLSNKNPWEVMHKILNGQPDEAMPGLRSLPLEVTADIGAYLQTLPKE
jgi:mono/diheme cytochrome c family protein